MNILEKFFYHLGAQTVKLFSLFDGLGAFFIFHFKLLPKYFSKPLRLRLVLLQIENIGINSLSVVLLTSVFTGLVMAIQLYSAFSKFGAGDMIGFTIFIAIGKELGPVFTALMIISRAISAMTAEIGTMKVTEQIDAMNVLGIDAKKYLIVPRVLAMVVSLPILVLIFDLVANASSYILATQALGVNPTVYMSIITKYAHFGDFGEGIIKGAIFGLVTSWIGTYSGYKTKGGAKGVGRATTKAVVLASVSLFLINYITSSFFILLG